MAENDALGLLAGSQSDLLNNPLLNFGIGLLAASGPSTRPANTGRGLLAGLQAAQSGQRQLRRNQLTRSRLETASLARQAAARTQAAQEALFKGIDDGEESDSPNAGQLALLARANPAAFTAAKIKELMPKGSVLERAFAATGQSLDTPEGLETFIKLKGGSNRGFKDLLDSLNVEKLIGEKRDKRLSKTGSFRTILNSSAEANQIVNRLDQLGVLGETGLSLDAARSILSGGQRFFKETFGIDVGPKDIQEIQRLTKRFGVVAQEIANAKAANATTDLERRNIAAGKMGLHLPLSVNRLSLRDTVSDTLFAADAAKFNIGNRADFQSIVDSIKGTSARVRGPSIRNQTGGGPKARPKTNARIPYGSLAP